MTQLVFHYYTKGWMRNTMVDKDDNKSTILFNFTIEKIEEEGKEHYKVYTDNSNKLVEYSGQDLLTIIHSLSQYCTYYSELSVKLMGSHSKGLDTTVKEDELQ